jgi:hypothetical protein
MPRGAVSKFEAHDGLFGLPHFAVEVAQGRRTCTTPAVATLPSFRESWRKGGGASSRRNF